jgi:hypothetical protein
MLCPQIRSDSIPEFSGELGPYVLSAVLDGTRGLQCHRSPLECLVRNTLRKAQYHDHHRIRSDTF